ncbi:uncharacterized protein LOC125228935 isoform X2 [Leguminivora glycinivorella]|uniref:uncharacterized protein LOC125228935 isoform X2 n=1 Tax=Leguminivora glycinivorella TaxID=1035111 RepID=UPI00200E418C|nr:uncharacterized protein LOC125228935 isoform X2 [Leguminivora glycinivorella]
MAALRLSVVLVVLAGYALADPVSFSAELTKKIKDAEESCKNIKDVGPHGSNVELCRYMNMGMLDKDGRYVESGAIDVITVDFPELTRDQVKRVAKTCNNVNENIAEGWQRANQVGHCLRGESVKITDQNTH